MSVHEAQPVRIKFYFDPVCPWAWRTSLWIREVALVRPLEIEWRIFSLQAINKGTASLKETHFKSEKAFRIIALLRRRYEAPEANELVNRFYLELGRTHHERQEDISQDETLRKILSRLEVGPELLSAAMNDDSTLDDVLAEHAEAVAAGSFGVPTLLLPGQTKGTFGPVINAVPTGQDAGQLWDRVRWLMERPEFFELKRSR